MPSSGRDWRVKWSHDVFVLKLSLVWLISQDGSAKTMRYYLMHIARGSSLNERDVLDTKGNPNKQEETNKTANINRALKERNRAKPCLAKDVGKDHPRGSGFRSCSCANACFSSNSSSTQGIYHHQTRKNNKSQNGAQGIRFGFHVESMV